MNIDFIIIFKMLSSKKVIVCVDLIIKSLSNAENSLIKFNNVLIEL